MALRVMDPSGTAWTVRRVWMHRRLRWRGPIRPRGTYDLMDAGDLVASAADLPVVGIVLLAVGLLIFAVGAVLLVVPALIFVVEVLIVLAIVGLGLLGRTMFGRPWTVEAGREGSAERLHWQVVGWRASRAQVRTVAEQLQATGSAEGGMAVAVDAGT